MWRPESESEPPPAFRQRTEPEIQHADLDRRARRRRSPITQQLGRRARRTDCDHHHVCGECPVVELHRPAVTITLERSHATPAMDGRSAPLRLCLQRIDERLPAAAYLAHTGKQRSTDLLSGDVGAQRLVIGDERRHRTSASAAGRALRDGTVSSHPDSRRPGFRTAAPGQRGELAAAIGSGPTSRPGPRRGLPAPIGTSDAKRDSSAAHRCPAPSTPASPAHGHTERVDPG